MLYFFRKLSLSLTMLIGFFLSANAQQRSGDYWTEISAAPVFTGVQYIVPEKYIGFELKVSDLRQVLSQAPHRDVVSVRQSQTILTLPFPDGSMGTFRVAEAPMMEAGLADKFPEIKTYVVQGLSDSRVSGRIDITSKGFHAMLFTPDGMVFIDPFSLETDRFYMSYYKKDFRSSVNKEFIELGLEGAVKTGKGNDRPQQRVASSGTELRTYRLACAATGEYTNFHGGTVPAAMAAIVTTVNRVVGVYEIDVAVSLTLVANNNLIVYTNSGTDPYTNASGGTMLGQNQSNLTSVIGSANYDIGHVFSTGGGGIASLGSVCNPNSKARGVTGRNAPVGDPFDIDFVAHEIGHQFGANHTFNGTSGSCSGGNRNGSTAYEPGSGTTIMAYAGICAPQNIQSNSNAYFHFKSYDEIIQFTTVGTGNICPVTTNTGNTPPTVDAGPSTFTIPMSTPFVLTGGAVDPDNNSLTFCWEEADLGPGGAPSSPTGDAPIFRSYSPTPDSSRTFPALSSILTGLNMNIGERLPNSARTMNFRLTVRDNSLNGGGVDFDTRVVPVAGNSGPFKVTSPNTPQNWPVNTLQTVTWDVANSDQMPVNCQTVNIRMSKDGGFTYPVNIASAVPNNGSYTFVMPNEPTTVARIKVEAADNIFFDLGDRAFVVAPVTSPQFSLMVDSLTKERCLPSQAFFDINTTALGGFTDTVTFSITGLPTGAVATFSANNQVPPFTSTVTISNLTSQSVGAFAVNLIGTSNSNTQTRAIGLNIFGVPPPAPTLLVPADQDGNVTLSPTFSWSPVPEAKTFTFFLATDPAFNTIVTSVSGIADTNYSFPALLPGGTVFYWRVSGSNVCGDGLPSAFNTFRTQDNSCSTYVSTDVPKTILTTVNSVTSTINVADIGNVTDVNIAFLQGSHTWISDLEFILTSPAGTSVTLFDQVCFNENNFNVKFDDAAGSATLPCPPVDGNFYRPEGMLSDFNGESITGNWVLTVNDKAAQDGGQLSNFHLELCYSTSISNASPVLATNDTLHLMDLGSGAITNSLLQASDVDNSAADLRFDLLTAPLNGQLTLSGTGLGAGDFFTQSDLDNGNVTYTHTATGTVADSFDFLVNDGAGGFIGSTTFNIAIDLLTGINSQLLSEIGVKVWPNPSEGIFNISFSEEAKLAGVQVEIFDNLGRKLLESTMGRASQGIQSTIDIGQFALGIYYLRVIAGNKVGVERIIKK